MDVRLWKAIWFAASLRRPSVSGGDKWVQYGYHCPRTLSAAAIDAASRRWSGRNSLPTLIRRSRCRDLHPLRKPAVVLRVRPTNKSPSETGWRGPTTRVDERETRFRRIHGGACLDVGV